MNRRTLLGLVLMAAIPVLGQTPAASNKAATEKQIVANERAVNEAFAKNDPKGFHALVAMDGISVDAGGISKVSGPDFDKMMASVKITSWNIDGSQFYWVGNDTVIHMYRWTGKGTYQGQPVDSPVWCSSTWTNRGGKWLAVFHQETNAMMPAPAKK